MKSLKILRRLCIIIGVVFSFATFISCTDGSAETSSLITDIYAPDVYAIYDGTPHYITIYGTADGDSILYSEDGTKYTSISPSFTLPGSYTVYYKINRTGYEELASSAKIIISYATLDGISAPDVTLFYDGLPHSITLHGTQDADVVTYSTDGENFSSVAPTFTEIGLYTVYYSVMRGYGLEKSSCTVTILPDIRGRYFNPSLGLIAIRDDGAYVNTTLKDCAFFVDGSGIIDDTSFSVSGETLTYGETDFTKISDDECVYKLSAAKQSIYFLAGNSGALTVSTEADECTISLGGDALFSVQNVNFCESAEIISYEPLIFEQAFEFSDEITEVALTLTHRDVNPFVPQTLYFMYNGQKHTFDYPEPFFCLDGEVHEYTEVGTYTVTLVFVSEEYLPLVTDCTLKIIQDLNGLYFSPERVIKIDGDDVYIDGENAGNLTKCDDGSFAFDGVKVTPTDTGIMYDGVNYTVVNSNVLIFRVNNIAVGRAAIASHAENITVVFDGETISFSDDDEVILTVSLSAISIELHYLDKALPPLFDSKLTVFVLGLAEVTGDTIILDAVTE